MDKGKSKTDLRAAGKKRLEEFRQKRQQKGSSTKPSSTSALKALTESEQIVGESAVEQISRRDSLLEEEAQRSSSKKDGGVESVVDHVHGDALEERHEVDVVSDTSPGSSVASSIQRLRVGSGHLTSETSEHSVEPGSSNGNLEDEEREAVYTILWENHEACHSRCNEEWQESTIDRGASLHERVLHQGDYSLAWEDNESCRRESKERSSTQRMSSGNPTGVAENFHSSKEWDESSLNLVPNELCLLYDAEAAKSRKNILSVDLNFISHSSFSNAGSNEDRMPPKRSEKLEENADIFSLSQTALGRCPLELAETKLQDFEEDPALKVHLNMCSEPQLREKLQCVQDRLQARELELIDARTKLEEACQIISDQQEDAGVHVQRNDRLQVELVRCQDDLAMLKSNLDTAEKEMVGSLAELQAVSDSFNGLPGEPRLQSEGAAPSMSEMVAEVSSLGKAIVEQAHRRELELQSANERAMAALLLELDSSKDRLSKFEGEFRECRDAGQAISWLNWASPPGSSFRDWATGLMDALQDEHRKSEENFGRIGSLTTTANENTLALQHLQEKIDSLHVELSRQLNETEAAAEDVRRRDDELQVARTKLQELAETNLVLESEVQSAKSRGHVENALAGIEEIVGDFGFEGRPSSTSSPSEWISWLVRIFREVSQELETSRSASAGLSVQVEETKNSFGRLFVDFLRQKNEIEKLQDELRVVHEMFDVERDSLQSEIQVLRESSNEFSRREIEFSVAHKALSNLQGTVTFKDRELSELREEVGELSVRFAQVDSCMQSLMEERESLSSQVVEVKAERNLLEAEMVQATNEKNTLQSHIDQLEQKLVAVREKLNLAINKGKGLVKQRDSLKKSLAEEAVKVESMVSSHAKDIQIKDSELLEMRAQAEVMDTRVQELQAEVTDSQQRMQVERQRLGSVFSGIELPYELLHKDPVDKVKWLVSLLEGARDTAKFLEGEVDSSRNALETLKEVLRDTEERLGAVTAESLRAQEKVSIFVQKVEEVESRAAFDLAQHKNEVDGLTRASKEADLQLQTAWSRVMEVEETLEKQQNTISASERAHSKTVTKLNFTRNKLNLLVQDSQELVRECESLHKSIQERDIEIVELNHEVDKLKNIIQIEKSQRMDAGSKTSSQLTLLQEELARTNEKFAATVKDLQERQVSLQIVLKEKDSELNGFRTKLEDMLREGDDILWIEHNIVHQNKGDDGEADIDVRSMNGSLDFASAVTTLEQRFSNLVAEAQLHKNLTDEKEALIQKLNKELHEVSTERTTLQAGVQAKTMEVERLRSEVHSKGAPVESNISAESEIEELGARRPWVGAGNPVTPHVRGPRRHSQADIAIDMDDASKSNLLSDMNDKEHGFSALTNSRLVPKATRVLADRLDGLWFVGGRILTRQPSARLGLAVYWIIVHVYMAMVFSRGLF